MKKIGKIIFLFLSFFSIIKCNKANNKFKIGGLLPELKYYKSFNQCFKNDNVQWADALSVFQFAKEKFNYYFKNYYKCDIELDLRSMKCDIAYGTKSFFDFANDTKSTLLMFGGSCDILQPIAESVKFFNLTLVSSSFFFVTKFLEIKTILFLSYLIPNQIHNFQKKINIMAFTD